MTRAALLLLLGLAGCVSAQPAPISYGGRDTPEPPTRHSGASRSEASETPPARTPAVQEPVPDPDWAAGEGTPLSAFALRPEDAQPYDPARRPRTHRVLANESLFDIAERYQTPLRALIEQNRLEPPYQLAPGQVLHLPPPRVHVVESGERFEDVARRYNVDVRSLALLNRMRPPYEVRAGERIVLPATARVSVSASPPSDLAPGPPADAPRFVWPLRGEVVARFGAQPDGARLDGVEIAGREGARIVAAAEGEVVYAGSDLPAYGTLVLIRHAGNYVTAYGYARSALVREGQRVRAGEPIAELGPRPDGGARLLFQVRSGREAVDPCLVLGAGC